MTTPNIGALAKLAPFHVEEIETSIGGILAIAFCEKAAIRWVDDMDAVAAALNEWAELRAYRERTEAALLSVCAKIQADMAEHEFRSPAERSLAIVTGVMLLAGLWREPGQGATDGN